MESHPIRTKALEILQGQFDCDQNGTKKGQTLKEYQFKSKNYHIEMSKCRITLSLRGGGWDTLRYWEIPAVGSMMISTELGIVIPNDFEDKKHIVRCSDNLDDLLDLGRYYLAHEDERQKIATAGREHLLKYHSNVARANYLLSTMRIKK
jgi:spore maturation protein CgeB